MIAVGSHVGRYELLRLLSIGGMGEVFLARLRSAVEGFGVLSAIKFLARHHCASPAFVQMFMDEARVVARLHHKNIVQVREIGEHDGQLYMVMEYIPGQNLRELLGDASIPDRPLFGPRLGAEVFAEIASALAAAHGRGLVHRDISPNNIMISDEGAAKLIDFGIARALDSASLTNPGTLKGKFGYMAPEYVRSQAYDHRVDIFSLGVVMWETFARKRLFRGTAAAEQLHQLLEANIPRLDTVVPDFPANLAQIVHGALARDPDARISSASQLVDLLTDAALALPSEPDSTLLKWLERRLPERIEDRRRTDQSLLELPAGSPIPDFGIASPNAGSVPGTFGGSPEGVPTKVLKGSATVAEPGHAPAPSNQPEPDAAAPVPATAKKRGVMLALAATAMAAIVLFALTRKSENRAAPRDAGAGSMNASAALATAELAPSPDASTLDDNVRLARAHREIGLKAMGDGDFAKARHEFEEAVRAGGASDELRQLIEMATGLEREANAGKISKVAVAEAAPADKKTPAVGEAKVARKSEPPPAPKKDRAPDRLTVRLTSRKPESPQKTAVKASEAGLPREPPSAATAPSSAPQPTTGDLVVSSVVEKALVIVDDTVVGQTPLRVPRLSPGSHQLTVKHGDQVLHSGTVQITAGETYPVMIKTTPAEPRKPATPADGSPAVRQPPRTAAAARPLPPPTPRVSADGDVTAGARVVGACNACHASAGVGTVSSRKYSQAQWASFFAGGWHDRYQRLGDKMTAEQLMAARAYLRANAADTAENQGAGIRD